MAVVSSLSGWESIPTELLTPWPVSRPLPENLNVFDPSLSIPETSPQSHWPTSVIPSSPDDNSDYSDRLSLSSLMKEQQKISGNALTMESLGISLDELVAEQYAISLKNCSPGDFQSEVRRVTSLAQRLAERGLMENGLDGGGDAQRLITPRRVPVEVPSSPLYSRPRMGSLPLPNDDNLFSLNGRSGRVHKSPSFNDGRDQRHRNPYAPCGLDLAGREEPRHHQNPYAAHGRHSPTRPLTGRTRNSNQHRLGRTRSTNGSKNLAITQQICLQNSPLMRTPLRHDYFETASVIPAALVRRTALRTERQIGQQDMISPPDPFILSTPQGLCLGLDDEIIVANTLSHNILLFDRNGSYKTKWGEQGLKNGHLWHPRKVAYLPLSQRIVVSDRINGSSRVQIFQRDGIHIRTLSNLHTARASGSATTTGLTTYGDRIIVVEVQPPACSILHDDGSVESTFSLRDMEEPSDVVFAGGKIFISDFRGHCVCAFNQEGQLLQKLGSGKEGVEVRFPRGLGLGPQGQLLVADTDMNRLHVSVWLPGYYAPETGIDEEPARCLSYHSLNEKVSHSCGIAMNHSGFFLTAVKKDNKILILKETEETQGPISRETRSFSATGPGLNVYAPDFTYRSSGNALGSFDQ